MDFPIQAAPDESAIFIKLKKNPNVAGVDWIKVGVANTSREAGVFGMPDWLVNVLNLNMM